MKGFLLGIMLVMLGIVGKGEIVYFEFCMNLIICCFNCKRKMWFLWDCIVFNSFLFGCWFRKLFVILLGVIVLLIRGSFVFEVSCLLEILFWGVMIFWFLLLIRLWWVVVVCDGMLLIWMW